MKKPAAVLCALLAACLAASACAEIPSSTLYTPAVSESWSDDGYVFTRAEDRSYTVRTDTDNIRYTDVFTVTVPLHKDISFLDWSDPENPDGPVQKGYGDLLALLLEDTNFSPYNTRLTFDENGKLVGFLYTYSPWN